MCAPAAVTSTYAALRDSPEPDVEYFNAQRLGRLQIASLSSCRVDNTMGACGSKGGHLNQVDDSVHVMLANDRKKRKQNASAGAPAAAYKPRAANPALQAMAAKQAEGGADSNGTPATEEKTEE